MGRSILTGNTDDKINILNNETPYTPTTDYNPATKKYVDDGLSAKQPTLVSGTNIKTVNGTTLLGSGNVAVQPKIFIDASRLIASGAFNSYTATEDCFVSAVEGNTRDYWINNVQLVLQRTGNFYSFLKQGDTIKTTYGGETYSAHYRVFGLKS